jgi:hypothetical protein
VKKGADFLNLYEPSILLHAPMYAAALYLVGHEGDIYTDARRLHDRLSVSLCECRLFVKGSVAWLWVFSSRWDNEHYDAWEVKYRHNLTVSSTPDTALRDAREWIVMLAEAGYAHDTALDPR